MTRVEPTLNELVGLASYDSVDQFEFFSTTPVSFDPIPLSPPSLSHFTLSPPTSPPFGISMDEFLDTRQSSRGESRSSRRPSPYPPLSKKHKPFGPQFLNHEAFLYRGDEEETASDSDDFQWQWDTGDTNTTRFTIYEKTKAQKLRTYARQDDRWVDPWSVAINQQPYGWRRLYLDWHRFPSGRPSKRWLMEYGNQVEVEPVLTAAPVGQAAAVQASSSSIPRSLISATPPSSVQPALSPVLASSCLGPFKKDKIVHSAHGNHAGGKVSSAGLELRKAAAQNAMKAAAKQLRRESSNEKISVS